MTWAMDDDSLNLVGSMDGAMETGKISKSWNWMVLVTDWMCGWDGEEGETNANDNFQVF